jgi:glucose-6-phosphate isomerase
MNISVNGASRAAQAVVEALVADGVASRIGAQDSSLWGIEAQPEASIRLGWVHASENSRALVESILELRDEFRARGLNRVVLCGMGGSSLAPEVITKTAGVELVVLDSTNPAQVSRVVTDRLDETVVVVSSKSGSTAETDSQKRIFESAFSAAEIDPLSRIVIVTDPGSPLDVASRDAGYRVFNADPTVGGRYSALTAFGLVPSGLAGVDIEALLDEADDALPQLTDDDVQNPGLILGAAMAATSPRRDKLIINAAESSIVGIGDWIEQLVAESTGKLGTGVLPVVVDDDAPELLSNWADTVVVHITDEIREAHGDDVVVAASLGAQLMLWEFATVVAGRILGINPFDQPDVESAKIAARSLLDSTPEPSVVAATDQGVDISTLGYATQAATLSDAVRELIATLASDGYLAVHVYADREAEADLDEIRNALASRAERPVTFGWGPRFLHSTGQYHKGGPLQGAFLQIVRVETADLEIPGRPFTFGELIAAQAQGDAKVLADHGRPVLTLTVRDASGIAAVRAACIETA